MPHMSCRKWRGVEGVDMGAQAGRPRALTTGAAHAPRSQDRPLEGAQMRRQQGPALASIRNAIAR